MKKANSKIRRGDRKEYSFFLNKILDLPDSLFKPYQVMIETVVWPNCFLIGNERWDMDGQEIQPGKIRKNGLSGLWRIWPYLLP